jgi:DNA helicase-2/ATP-dependent DNA helicase PcrA
MGPANAQRCFEALALGGYLFSSLTTYRPPAGAKDDWPGFCELLRSLAGAEADCPAWQSQLAEVRRWYRPQLERLYDGIDTRDADLDQLEQISGRYATRERFLTELTLDPPAAAGDLAGDPLRDEDYLILSTVHSAKGQEWDAVILLNVTDGNFPSEFSTGKDELIEEERRLLYVAMTRARHSLSLVAPLRFHVTQQRRDGDKHVYGARSRFVTDSLLATMQQSFHGREPATSAGFSPRSTRRLDVGTRLRDTWS